MPPLTEGAPSKLRETPPTSNRLNDTPRLTQQPTRILTPGLSMSPTPLTSKSILYSNSPQPLSIFSRWSDGRPAKRQRLMPLPSTRTLQERETDDLPIGEDVPQDSTGQSITPHPNRHRTCAPPNTDITQAPSLHFSQVTWWDSLLSTYTIRPNASSAAIPRDLATAEISQDVCVFFRAAPLWVAFLNIPLFFDSFYHPDRRATIQPALVLSILAYAKLVQSNHDMTRGLGPEERDQTWKRSVMLKDLAQASLEASYNAGWIDMSLAQAAWILALYEMSPRKDYAPHRMESASVLLDNVLRVLGLATIDSMDPRAPTFAADAVPSLGRSLPNGARDYQIGYGSTTTDSGTTFRASLSSARSNGYKGATKSSPFDGWRFPVHKSLRDRDVIHRPGPSTRCPCVVLSLSKTPELLRNTPSWLYLPRWAPNASLGEIRKEEARRLVWTSVIMLGADAIVRRAAGLPMIDLHVSKPENFALLYPGENDYSSLPDVDALYSGKESNWALWARVTLLWFACTRRSYQKERNMHPSKLFDSSSSTDEDITMENDAEFAMRVWMETVAIEDALDSHACDTEQSMIYQAREVLFMIRMEVSGGFRQSIPMAQTGSDFSLLDRESAMKWARHADCMATVFLKAISDDNPGRKLLGDRPFVGYICLGALLRAVEFCKLDWSLVPAIDAAKKLLRLISWYQQVWPCAETQRWTARASRELESICETLDVI